MRFTSRFRNHILVLEPAIRGEKPGRRVEFKDGVYETTDKGEIKAIRGCRDFGLFIFEDAKTIRDLGVLGE